MCASDFLQVKHVPDVIGTIEAAVLVKGSNSWREATNVLLRAHNVASTHMCDNMQATFGECRRGQQQPLPLPGVHDRKSRAMLCHWTIAQAGHEFNSCSPAVFTGELISDEALCNFLLRDDMWRRMVVEVKQEVLRCGTGYCSPPSLQPLATSPKTPCAVQGGCCLARPQLPID